MKYSLIFIISIFAILAFSSCSDDDCNPMQIPDCACTAVYIPVCGCDNVTYGNACEAECNSITDYRDGECE